MAGPLGTLLTVLGIDARQVQTGLNAAERAVDTFSQLKPEVALHVDDAGVTTDVASAARAVGSFDQLDASALLNVDDAGVQGDISSAAQAVNAFDQETASASITIDDSTLMADLRAVDAELRRVTGQKKQLIRLGIDSGPLIDELDVAEHKLRESARKMGGAMDSIGPSVTKAGGFFTRFGEIGKGAIMGIGLAVGSMATNFLMALPTMAIGKFGDAVALARDKAESSGKANIIFGDSFGIIEEKSKSAAETVGLSSGAYLTAAGDVGNLITNLGFAGDEAANMSTDIVQLAADVGAFNNAPTAEVVQAIGSAFRGETEPIRRFGVNLSEAAVQEKAVTLGLVASTKAFNDLDFATKNNIKAQATYALILDGTAKAQGNFALTSSGLAVGQQIAAAKMEEAWTKVGDTLAPIAADILPVLAGAMVAAVDAIGGLVRGAKEVVDAIQPVIKPFTDFIGASKGAGEVARTAAGGIVALGVAFVGLKITGLLGPMKSLVGLLASGGTAALTFAQSLASGAGLSGALSAAFTKAGVDPAVNDAAAKSGTKVGGRFGLAFKLVAVIGIAQIASELDAPVSQAGRDLGKSFWGNFGDVDQGLAHGTFLDSIGDLAHDAWNKWSEAPWPIGSGKPPTPETPDPKPMLDDYANRFKQNGGNVIDTVSAMFHGAGTAGAEAFEASVNSSGSWAEAGRTAFTDTGAAYMQEAARWKDKALEPWRAIGRAIPGQIGQGMQEAATVLVSGANALRDILENGLGPKKLAMQAIGADYIQLVRDGMDSKKFGAKETAVEVAIAAIAAIEQAGLQGQKGQRGLKAIGIYFDELLAGGMTGEQALAALSGAGVDASSEALAGVRSKYPQFFGAGETITDKVESGIESESLYDSGRSFVGTWLTGIRSRYVDVERVGNQLANRLSGPIHFSTPPSKGPLSHIREFGPHMIEQWIGPMLSHGNQRLSSVGATLAGQLMAGFGEPRPGGLELATARVGSLGVDAPGLGVAATVGNRGGDVHIHVGTLVADEGGLRALEERMSRLRRFSMRGNRLTDDR